jgi:MYXO-CTERM domain-containing protein
MLFAAPALASPWTWLSPTPGGFGINAADFPTAQEGFFVGVQGTIIVTEDSGTTFQSQTAPTDADLYGVFFLPDGLVGWAVGAGGTILATVDGGTSWTLQTSGTQRLLYAVYFTDSLHGFCAGEENTLLQTANGGATWTGRNGQLLNLNALAFPDAQHGFAVGWGGNIIFTIDGGNTWSLVFTGVVQDLLGTAFIDDDNGWAVGAAGTILKTSDGAQSWQVQGANVTTQDLVAVVAVSATVAYAVTSEGTFLYTLDGSTWQAGAFYYQDTLTSLALTPSGALWIGSTDGHLYYAPGGGTAGGQFFIDANQGLQASETVVGIAFADPQHGVLTSGDEVYYTTNGGVNLSYGNIPSPTVTSRPFPTWTAVAMPNTTTAFAVGTGGGVITSNSGGATWTWLSDDASFTTDDFYGVYFLSPLQGWIVGEEGVVLSTTNGGASWVTTSAFTPGSLRSVYFLDATHGFAVGDYGSIIETTDGLTWTSASSQFVSQTLNGIGGVPPGPLFAVGQSGYMVESPDDGVTWEQVAAPVNADMTGIWFADPLDGYLVTAKPGQILVTHDQGTTWQVEMSGIPSLFALDFTDLLHGFAGGTGGTLLGTVSGGEPSCQTVADCPGLDGGSDVAFLCQSGACAPCNNDQTCGATCTPCGGPVPYCLGGFCGQCRDQADCTDGGVCISGGCVINVPVPVPDGGSGADGGESGGTDGGKKVVTILPDGGIEIDPLAACGCRPGGDSGTSPWVAIGLMLLAGWGVSRRRRS